MDFEYKKIGELGEIVTGKTPPTDISEYFNGKYPFITPTDISTFYEKYLLETERTISDQGKEKLKNNILPKGSICFVCIGSTIGKMCMTNKDSFTNQQINAIVPNEAYDNDYLFYFLRYIREYFQSIGAGTGSGKGIVNKTTFSNSKVRVLIDKIIQKNTVSILIQYDNVIEKNNKKISNLEKVIEQIYKEWFVRFRFPEFKNYKFIEEKPYGWIYGNKSNMKIPYNWHFGKLDEIGQFVRGKNITSADMQEGEVPVISAGIEPSGYHNKSNVKGKSLTMSASGANAGYLKYNLDDIWAADCSYYQKDENIWFVYSSLKFIESAIKNLQVGSAQPHVYAKNINKLNIIIPERKYIKMYNDLVNPMFEEIKKINERNKILMKQRDLLLPRLMSGKLEIK